MTVPADIQRDRETVALTVIAIGVGYELAARRLSISSKTLQRYLMFAMTRLGAATPAHAVALAVAAGQLDAEHLLARTCPPWPVEGPISSGPLRVDVHRHLTDHPDLTAHQIARALSRSQGSVKAALVRMEMDGEAARQEGQRTPTDTRPSIRWRAT